MAAGFEIGKNRFFPKVIRTGLQRLGKVRPKVRNEVRDASRTAFPVPIIRKFFIPSSD